MLSVINIEKSVLSSIVFNPEQLDEVAKTIMPKDFYLPAHQDIYQGFLLLQSLDLPIDEEFLNKKCNIDTQAMIEIMALNPISNLTAYIKELKQDSLKRQVESVAKEVACGDLKSIDQLAILKLELENVGNLKKLKKLDNADRFWDSQDMDAKEVENSKFEYLLDNFIVKNEITMVAARPNLGKSLTAFAIANMVLTDQKIQTVFYLDGDNGVTTIKERKIHHVKEKWGKRLRYIQGKNSSELQRIMKELLSLDLTDCLLVFDSIKNFMVGGDRDKNKDVSKVMEVLKTLRNNGATVIFLHHSNKPQKDVDDLMYAGSSAWGEDTGNAYILKKNEDKQSFLFHPIKKRTGDLESIAFKYNQEHHALAKVDFTEASETQEIEQINSEIIAFIEEQTQKPTYSQIMQHLTKEGFARNKSNEALQSGKGRYWREEKLTQNNRSVYMLIKQPVVVEYEDISKSSQYKSYKSYSRVSLAPTLNEDRSYKWQKDGISETSPVIIHKNTHIDMSIL